MPASRAAAKAAGVCKEYTICLLETLFSRGGPSWSCMRPVPQPGFGVGQVYCLLENAHLVWAMNGIFRTPGRICLQPCRLRSHPVPVQPYRESKIAAEVIIKNCAGDNEMQAKNILSARTWLKSHGTECWCRNASTSLGGDFEIREVPSVTGSGLDRSCLESSCYSIRLEGGCDASRLNRHLCMYLPA